MGEPAELVGMDGVDERGPRERPVGDVVRQGDTTERFGDEAAGDDREQRRYELLYAQLVESGRLVRAEP